MRRRNLVLLISLALLVSLAALPTLAWAVHIGGNPEVQILAPTPVRAVSSLGGRLEISPSNFTLEPVVPGRANEANHGHFNVYVNDSWKSENSERIVDLVGFPVGPMKLGVQLVNNDNTSLTTQVWHNISVDVVAPSIALVNPANNGAVSTMGARFQVDVQGFELDVENYNGEPIPGHGHYHAFVDGVQVGTPQLPFFDVGSLTSGLRTITVNLRTNNHQFLVPNAEASIDVTAAAPSIAIVAPFANAMVSTLGIELQVDVTGFELDTENYNGNPIPGHGHYHVFVDGTQVGTPQTPTFAIGPLTAGAHTITVNLRTNDHQFLVPNAEATITVTAAAPSISISEPANDATVGPVVFIRMQVAGFVIDPEAIDQAAVPGRGHIHVTVDGTTIDFGVTGTVYAVKDLAEGSHTIAVSLHNNDHTDLSPAVSDQITVAVEVAAPPPPPPAGVDPLLFAGTTIGLIIVLIVVAAALILWGRRGRQGPGT